MRRLLTILTAIALSLASLAIGLAAADLPFWQRAVQLPLATDSIYLPVASIGGDAQSMPLELGTSAQMSKDALEGAVARARDSGVRALLAARAGKPVLARYFGADDDRTLLPAGLIARPLAAMAIGRAIGDGELPSVDAQVAKYLPEWDDEPRGHITLRQLLEDTSGLQTGGEVHGLLRRSPWENLGELPVFATSRRVRLLLGNDFASTALGFQLEHEPGGFHNESPANTQIAALILERATSIPYEHYLDLKLWQPIGAGHAELTMDRRAGMPAAHCCWLATAPDMLRVLGLLATNGVYEGRQVLPPGWADEMMRPSRVNPDGGMQLKLITVGGVPAVSGEDDDGNTFWVFPARQLVIVSIVNSAGSNSLELPAQLLRVLGSDQ